MAEVRTQLRFIHAADVHLDSPLLGLDSYEGAPVEAIRRDAIGATEACRPCHQPSKLRSFCLPGIFMTAIGVTLIRGCSSSLR